jgi:hypothetical protein
MPEMSEIERNTLQRYAAARPPYAVPNSAYEAACAQGAITLDELHEWGMSPERIAEIGGQNLSGGVSGCMDAGAVNFNPLATIDDGSCQYMGCTDRTASNFNPKANIDDGSCVYSPPPMPIGTSDIDQCTLEQLVAKVVAGELADVAVKSRLGLSNEDWTSIMRHYNENKIPGWDGIPVLPARKTDLWVLGIPGSGKSAMLSAVLGRLEQTGVLLDASYGTHTAGYTYRRYLENAYKLNIAPEATQVDGFNFVPLDLWVDIRRRKYQPGNLIEMAGDKVRNILEKRNSSDSSSLASLDWLMSRNPKIITIVLDVMSNDLNERADLSMTFQMLRDKGVLNRTEKVILLVTKSDTLPSFSPNGSPELTSEVDRLVRDNYTALITTIKAFTNVKIHVTPFSVGSGFIKEKFIKGGRHYAFIDEYIRLLREGMLIHKL